MGLSSFLRALIFLLDPLTCLFQDDVEATNLAKTEATDKYFSATKTNAVFVSCRTEAIEREWWHVWKTST